nr:phosphotriesterase-related protein [Parasteatoda tepidariorum]
MQGKAVTVLGPVEPESLGLTLTHEHLLHDLKLSVFKQPVPNRIEHATNISLFSLENLGYIRQYPYCYDFNIEFNSVGDAIKEEMDYFKSNGGGTIVDNCSIGLRANGQADYLEELSQSTGVKIVAGSGDRYLYSLFIIF